MIKSGKQLKALRTAFKWTQSDLATHAKVHEKTVAWMERSDTLERSGKVADVISAFQQNIPKTEMDASAQAALDTAELIEAISHGAQS